MGYLALGFAIACEVCATLSLRASDGFSKLHFTVIVVVGYVASFALLSLALKHGVPLAIAYAIWSCVGICVVAILSGPLFGEALSLVQAFGIGLVLIGVVAIEIGGEQ
jgi:small multidrug resistance pump